MQHPVRSLLRASMMVAALAACAGPGPSTTPTASPSASPTPSATTPAAAATSNPSPSSAPRAPFVFVPAGPPPTELARTATTERDGVRVTLTLERALLEVGTPSTVTVTIRNIGRRDVRWITDGCGSPVDTYAPMVGENWIGGEEQTGIRAEFKAFALEPMGHSGYSPLFVGFEDLDSTTPDGAGCADIGLGFELAAGKSLTRNLAWTGGTVVAPDGPIEVTASFRYDGHVGEDNDDRFEPIVARLPSWLVSGWEPPYLPPGPAIDAALADDRFATWLEAAPSSTWINTHHALKANDTWDIGLFRDGAAGFYGGVTIDAQTGEVLNHRFE